MGLGLDKKGKSLCVLVSVMTVGCGITSVQAKKVIKWWAPNELNNTELAKRFEKDNKDVDVQLIPADSIDKFYTMITAGMMPDVWGPWSTPGIRADVNRNWALDLTPYIKRDGRAMNIDDFFPGLMREFRVNGHQYSLPVFNYVDYYFYHVDMYANAGLMPPPSDASDKNWNWDRMVANAQKMTKYRANGAIDIAGIEVNTWPLEQNWMHLWNAFPYSDEALKSAVPQRVYFDTPEMTRAFTKVWELVNKYRVARPDTLQFGGGKTASSILCGSTITQYMKTKFRWAIAPLPWGVTNKGTMWPDGWRISRVSKNKELAWSFVKYLAEPANLTYTVTEPKGGRVGSAAARKSVFKDTMARMIAKQTGMDSAVISRIHEQADEVGIVKWQETICLDKDLEKYRAPIMTEFWQNRKSPEQAVRELQKAVDKALPTLYQRWIRDIKFTGKETK